MTSACDVPDVSLAGGRGVIPPFYGWESRDENKMGPESSGARKWHGEMLESQGLCDVLNLLSYRG